MFGYQADEIVGALHPEAHSRPNGIRKKTTSWPRRPPASASAISKRSAGARTAGCSMCRSASRRFAITTVEIVGVSKIARDITDGSSRRKRRRCCCKELNHRSKNLLAVADAIVRQTAKSTSATELVEPGQPASACALDQPGPADRTRLARRRHRPDHPVAACLHPRRAGAARSARGTALHRHPAGRASARARDLRTRRQRGKVRRTVRSGGAGNRQMGNRRRRGTARIQADLGGTGRPAGSPPGPQGLRQHDHREHGGALSARLRHADLCADRADLGAQRARNRFDRSGGTSPRRRSYAQTVRSGCRRRVDLRSLPRPGLEIRQAVPGAYLLLIRVVGGGGADAGESTSVIQLFQPSGRFRPSNSL